MISTAPTAAYFKYGRQAPIPAWRCSSRPCSALIPFSTRERPPSSIASVFSRCNSTSARNAASDKLPIAAFRLKHLTDAQRREIAQELAKQRDLAIGAAGAAADYAVGSEVPAPVALQALTPVPEALVAKLPALGGTGYMRAGGKLLLVDLDNSQVVGVLED